MYDASSAIDKKQMVKPMHIKIAGDTTARDQNRDHRGKYGQFFFHKKTSRLDY